MLSEISIVNASKLFPNPDSWLPMVSALQIQMCRDVGVVLGVIPPPLVYYTAGSKTPGNSAVVTIVDTPDEPDALGYHDEDSLGRVYGKVFVKPTVDNGGTLSTGPNSVSVTLSHEVIEIIGNRFVQLWCDNFRDGHQYAAERCDPVESDPDYIIDGISVSNFVTDRWFDSEAPSGEKFDFLGNLKAPFSMTSGGYLERRLPGGKEEQLFGEYYPAWKAVLKARSGRLATRNKK